MNIPLECIKMLSKLITLAPQLIEKRYILLCIERIFPF